VNPLLNNFRDEYLSSLLDYLWQQWSALGVAGYSAGKPGRAVDLEALLLMTCTVGRHDPRLFDEMLDWLQLNGWLVNVARLKRILRVEKFAGESVLSAVAGFLAAGTEAPKWKQLAAISPKSVAMEPLFFGEDGEFLPVVGGAEPQFAGYGLKRGALHLRELSQEFRPADTGTIVLQLRALFGVNVRSEILFYLMSHETAHPSQIAREGYYFERAVQGTLVDMSRSGVIQVRATGREKRYWLKREEWIRLLNRTEQTTPRWTTWPPLLRALEQIWLRLNDGKLLALDGLLQSSEARQLMTSVRPALERAGFDTMLTDDRQHLGESYLPVFMGDVKRVIASLHCGLK
jgi:hypothetical protein